MRIVIVRRDNRSVIQADEICTTQGACSAHRITAPKSAGRMQARIEFSHESAHVILSSRLPPRRLPICFIAARCTFIAARLDSLLSGIIRNPAKTLIPKCIQILAKKCFLEVWILNPNRSKQSFFFIRIGPSSKMLSRWRRLHGYIEKRIIYSTRGSGGQVLKKKKKGNTFLSFCQRLSLMMKNDKCKGQIFQCTVICIQNFEPRKISLVYFLYYVYCIWEKDADRRRGP